jgi:phosphomannomutase/phosphomannomutase/phosphoglucomutase
MDPVIFREYDIRGVFGRDFDTAFATTLGQAYVTYLAREHRRTSPVVALGHDARLSSPELVAALASGLTRAGANVAHLGLVTTPMTYFATFARPELDGAIMVTASHNPPDHNGFKIAVGTATIFGADIQKLLAIVESGEFVRGSGREFRIDIAEQYVERYAREFGSLHVPLVLDCGNGVAGTIARALYGACGLEPAILFEEPDGRFPNHHPDPTIEANLADLAREVRLREARAGIAFDGDGDRIGVVDAPGDIVDADDLMALYSRAILVTRPGARIVADVKSSDRLFHDIERHGGIPVMWKSGYSLIKEKVRTERAPFGGELSGHLFFADRNYGYDDALYAGLRLAEILSESGATIGELLADLPRACSTPELRIETTEEKKHAIVAALRRDFSRTAKGCTLNLLDGLRVSFPDGWALARASNTQPVLVMRFEAASPESLEAIRSRFAAVVDPLL